MGTHLERPIAEDITELRRALDDARRLIEDVKATAARLPESGLAHQATTVATKAQGSLEHANQLVGEVARKAHAIDAPAWN